MDRLAEIGVVVGAVAILGVLLLVGLTVSIIMSLDSEPQNFSHQIEYSFELTANDTMNNTVIHAPYPQDERFRRAIENSSKISNLTITNDLNASTSITESGYLKLDIGDFDPEKPEERFSDFRDETSFNQSGEIRRQNVSNINQYTRYVFYVRIEYNRSIDTRSGLDSEPNLPSNSTECQNARESGCASTKAHLDYDASNRTYLEFNVDIEGRNTWQDGFNRIGNSYRQNFYNSYYENIYLKGSQDRWVELTGREVEGDGSYPID